MDDQAQQFTGQATAGENAEARLTLLTSIRGGNAVCQLTGDLDGASSPWLLEELELLPACGVTHLVLDVSNLALFGAAGVEVFVAARSRLGPLGSVCVRSPSAAVVRVLEVHGLRGWVEPGDCRPSRESASLAPS
jgi:anti-anti-sigma factor